MSTAAASSADPQSTASNQEDPLIAALPPNTDYITYLTILEYQLTPQNLSTLNNLLLEDDGTLASEIGWDLLKLVLPILRVAPDKAKECLEIIARRGNPREVVVRVAEELETLGFDDSDDEEDTDASDGPPAFAGEAPPVHLGSMSLTGMPGQSKVRAHRDELDHDASGPDAAIGESKLQALLTMLGHLHPRIKTQYPSRFLATSLPAGLGAYRRLSMGSDSTVVFLNVLTKLFGRKRPALPPRLSTSDMLNLSAANAVPLPDPESTSSNGTASKVISDNEIAINRRLLQAVLLEIVDEHITNSSEAQPPLTARLRMQFEPRSLTSVRKAELGNLTTSTEAQRADDVRKKFVATAHDLELDVKHEIEKLNETNPDSTEDEEEHEYPTAPSQIPISATGLLLLYSAQTYFQTTSQHSHTSSDITISKLFSALDFQYENDARLRSSPPAIDSLLALLYPIFCIPPSSPHQPLPIPSHPHSQSDSETLLLAIYNILQDIFTTCPDLDLRDNAHHLATHLIHGHSQRDTRVKIIATLLRLDKSTAPSPIHEAQTGNLKSIAVEWLKDELYPTPMIEHMMSRIYPVGERGLEVSAVVELADLIFPVEQVDGVPTSQAPGGNAPSTESFVTDLSFYISSLNLFSLLAKGRDTITRSTQGTRQTSSKTSPSAAIDSTTKAETGSDIVLAKGGAMLDRLEAWSEYLSSTSVTLVGSHEEESGVVSIHDMLALKDAIGRAREMFHPDT